MYNDEYFPSLGNGKQESLYMTLNSSFGPQAYEYVPERYQSQDYHINEQNKRN